MPLPPGVSTITVTGTFYRQTGVLAGEPAVGTISFKQPMLTVPSAGMILPRETITATLDANGSFSVVLLVTNSALITKPLSWAYEVSADLTDAVFQSNAYQFPDTYGATVELADVPPVTDPTGDCDVVTCITSEQFAELQQEVEEIIDAGIVTSIIAGDGIDVDQATGNVTVTVEFGTGANQVPQGNEVVYLSTIDAKGDLFVGTADNTVGRLPVGSDGFIIIGESGASAGLRYAPLQQGNLLASGEEVVYRDNVSSEVDLADGDFYLSFFTARKTETITSLFTVSGNAATGTTLARIGIYSINGAGNGTLVASTANDLALWSGFFTPYTPALSAPWSKVSGNRYAVGIIWTGVTPPAVECCPIRYGSAGFAPRIQGQLSGLTDLPANFTDASLSTSHKRFQMIVRP